MFVILEYSYISTLQSVLSACYKLCNCWSEVLTTDSAAGCILRRNLISTWDRKMQIDVTALHVAASYLDPSLKTSFLNNTRERKNLLEQGVKAARENALSCIFVTDESEDSEIKDIGESSGNDVASKKTKYDPFAEFRNADLDTSKGTCCESKDFEADVEEELRCYNSIAEVGLQQPNAVRSVFDPLLWRGQQRYSFPILSCMYSYQLYQLLVQNLSDTLMVQDTLHAKIETG